MIDATAIEDLDGEPFPGMTPPEHGHDDDTLPEHMKPARASVTALFIIRHPDGRSQVLHAQEPEIQPGTDMTAALVNVAVKAGEKLLPKKSKPQGHD